MSAQDDIRDLMFRYCEMIDAGDVDGLVELFARRGPRRLRGNSRMARA